MSGTRFLDQVRDCLRFKHYSLRTEEAYTHWIKRLIFFHDRRLPCEMDAREVEKLRTCLRVPAGVGRPAS